VYASRAFCGPASGFLSQIFPTARNNDEFHPDLPFIHHSDALCSSIKHCCPTSLQSPFDNETVTYFSPCTTFSNPSRITLAISCRRSRRNSS
jgi:hypothetical protein